MIDINRALDIIKKQFPEVKPSKVYMYKNDYYMIVGETSGKKQIDPFYLVDRGNGRYRQLNPLEDMAAFDAMIKRGPIKTL